VASVSAVQDALVQAAMWLHGYQDVSLWDLLHAVGRGAHPLKIGMGAIGARAVQVTSSSFDRDYPCHSRHKP